MSQKYKILFRISAGKSTVFQYLYWSMYTPSGPPHPMFLCDQMVVSFSEWCFFCHVSGFVPPPILVD